MRILRCAPLAVGKKIGEIAPGLHDRARDVVKEIVLDLGLLRNTNRARDGEPALSFHPR